MSDFDPSQTPHPTEIQKSTPLTTDQLYDDVKRASEGDQAAADRANKFVEDFPELAAEIGAQVKARLEQEKRESDEIQAEAERKNATPEDIAETHKLIDGAFTMMKDALKAGNPEAALRYTTPGQEGVEYWCVVTTSDSKEQPTDNNRKLIVLAVDTNAQTAMAMGQNTVANVAIRADSAPSYKSSSFVYVDVPSRGKGLSSGMESLIRNFIQESADKLKVEISRSETNNNYGQNKPVELERWKSSFSEQRNRRYQPNEQSGAKREMRKLDDKSLTLEDVIALEENTHHSWEQPSTEQSQTG